MENSLKKALNEKIAKMSIDDVWKYHIEVRSQISEATLVKKAIENRLREELGENEQLEIADGDGVYWENRNIYTISLQDVEDVVGDMDQVSLITKVDLKKAKEVLDKETYIALEGKRKIESSTKAFKTGKLKSL